MNAQTKSKQLCDICFIELIWWMDIRIPKECHRKIDGINRKACVTWFVRIKLDLRRKIELRNVIIRILIFLFLVIPASIIGAFFDQFLMLIWLVQRFFWDWLLKIGTKVFPKTITHTLEKNVPICAICWKSQKKHCDHIYQQSTRILPQ